MTSLDLSFECAKVVIFADGKGMVCEVLWFLGAKKRVMKGENGHSVFIAVLFCRL